MTGVSDPQIARWIPKPPNAWDAYASVWRRRAIIFSSDRETLWRPMTYRAQLRKWSAWLWKRLRDWWLRQDFQLPLPDAPPPIIFTDPSLDGLGPFEALADGCPSSERWLWEDVADFLTHRRQSPEMIMEARLAQIRSFAARVPFMAESERQSCQRYLEDLSVRPMQIGEESGLSDLRRRDAKRVLWAIASGCLCRDGILLDEQVRIGAGIRRIRVLHADSADLFLERFDEETKTLLLQEEEERETDRFDAPPQPEIGSGSPTFQPRTSGVPVSAEELAQAIALVRKKKGKAFDPGPALHRIEQIRQIPEAYRNADKEERKRLQKILNHYIDTVDPLPDETEELATMRRDTAWRASGETRLMSHGPEMIQHSLERKQRDER